MPTQADVERIRKAMEAMPEVKAEERNLKNQEAVAALSADIEAMRSKGYTWEQVAEFFGTNGITIKPTTLKSYARRAAAGSAKARKPRQRKPAPAAVPPAASAAPVRTPVQQTDKPKPGTKQKPSDADAHFKAREDSSDI